MAGAGYRNWTAGDIPTADQFDTFLQEQTVMRFASAAARDAALSVVKAEGMVAYLLDTNALTVYSGSVWSTIGIVSGVWTSWTPTVTQLGSVTVTNSGSNYQRNGRMITARLFVTVTGSGTTANAIIVGGLPAAAAVAGVVIGAGTLFDVSLGLFYPSVVWQESGSTISMFSTAGNFANPRQGVTGMSAGLAVNDNIHATFTYEAAADA